MPPSPPTIPAAPAQKRIGDCVAAQIVGTARPGRVFDGHPVCDREAAGDVILGRDEATRIRVAFPQGGRTKIDGRTGRARRGGDGIGTTGIPEAGPSRRAGGQIIGVIACAGRMVRSIESLQRRDIEGPKSTLIAIGQIAAGLIPSGIVRHDRPDALVQTVGACGIRVGDAGERRSVILRSPVVGMSETQAVPELMDDRVQAVAAEIAVLPGFRGRIEIAPVLVLRRDLMTADRFVELGLPEDHVGVLDGIRHGEGESADRFIEPESVGESVRLLLRPGESRAGALQVFAGAVLVDGLIEVDAFAEPDPDRSAAQVPGRSAPDEGVDIRVPIAGARHEISNARHDVLQPEHVAFLLLYYVPKSAKMHRKEFFQVCPGLSL